MFVAVYSMKALQKVEINITNFLSLIVSFSPFEVRLKVIQKSDEKKRRH